jgi:hypothetical protein
MGWLYVMSTQSLPACTSARVIKPATRSRLAVGLCTDRMWHATACGRRPRQPHGSSGVRPAQHPTERIEALTTGVHRVNVQVAGRFRWGIR